MSDETNVARDPNEITISESLVEDAKGLEMLNEYWTEEAMAEAVPIFTEEDESDALKALSEEVFEPEGEQELAKPTHAAENEMAAWLPQPPCSVPNGPNTQRVTTRNQIPYSAVGKMYMTFDNKNYVGSAWTIENRGVFTAGHCVYDRSNGGWADRVLFVPQFASGAEPVGRWAGTRLISLHGWTDNRDFRYDMAGFTVDRPIRNRTGSLGWIANGPVNNGCLTGIGYPAAAPFDGKSMWYSSGRYIGGNNPYKSYNDMTGGCSGGPIETWRNGIPYTVGVNSFRYRNEPKTMNSPYFGTGFLNLRRWLAAQ